MAEELKVIADFYYFMLWMIRHVEQFPRHHRYSLGMTIENRLQAILCLLLQAKYTKDRRTALERCNIELEILRFQVRLAKDLKALASGSHGHSVRQMLDIGVQVGGWFKACK